MLINKMLINVMWIITLKAVITVLLLNNKIKH